MNLPTLAPRIGSSNRSRTLHDGWRRLQDHLMLNIYGGVSREDLARYSDQPETLAGLIATRTGRSRQSIRAWLSTALGPWHHA